MSRSDEALIGQKGVKYGLQVRGPPAANKKPAAPVRPASIFGDDDSEDDVEAQVAKQAEKKRSAQKVQSMYEAALAEDPSVFDYDGVYDSIQTARTQPKVQEKVQRQSKYIAQLKEHAEHRKREEDVRYERRLLKERAAEDALFEDKEKFVTSAYRKKLEEDKKWAEEQKRRDEEDERNDVRKVGHLGNFYANLLTKNVAMGAKQHEAKKSPSPAAEDIKADVEPGVKLAPSKAPVLDKYELLRLEAEKARRAQANQGEGEHAGTEQSALQPEEPVKQAEQPSTQQEVPPDPTQSVTTSQPQLPAKRRNDEDAVMSARERYLARKKLQVG